MTHAQINPLLVQVLSNEEVKENIPTISSVPGKYVREMFNQIKAINPISVVNHQTLTCTSCGRKGKYDVGMIVVNVDKKDGNMSDNIQTTGYYRCKHCNAAGNWELPQSMLFQALTAALPLGDKGISLVGKNLLFDGSWHKHATDAEEYLLHLIQENPNDSYLWNRLGNIYRTGNRPELATSAYEHSIAIDPKQVESHYTLGLLLLDIKDYLNAGYHIRQSLLYAEGYKKLEAMQLREMLAIGLQSLLIIHYNSEGSVPFIPTEEERQATGRFSSSNGYDSIEIELDIDPNEISTFYPLAEMYMGIRAKEINLRNRTYQMPSTTPSKKKKVRKKKRKR
ncbi:hypothetical protein AB3U99_21705 [Niallia sp. JL1B1071]|uniref:hypothetical protein n=1 Tax=Niallia tiangongensis TaxID=3237105 RepID=UPI0037DC1A88